MSLRTACPAPLLLLGAAALLGLPAAGARLPDETVIARVGAATIPRQALVTHLLTYYGRVGVEQLIDRSVMRQEAETRKLTVTDAEVEARAAQLKGAGGVLFQGALQKEGITEAIWKERLRWGLLAEKLRDAKWPVQDADLLRFSVRYARVNTERQARDLGREAKNRVSFELLVRQNSLDKENDGLVQPNPFLRVDNPPFFKMAYDADLRPGQVSQPIEKGGSWLVLKLERRLEAGLLQGKERADAISRVKFFRMLGLLSASRRSYKITYPTSLASLIADPKAADGVVVGQVGSDSINRKALVAHLLENAGKAGMEQLVERSIIAQEALKLRAAVSDAEVTTRAAALEKNLGKTAYARSREAEGITEEAARDRIRFELLSEKVITLKYPAPNEDLERFTARFIPANTRAEAEQLIRAAQTAPFEALQARVGKSLPGGGFIQPRAFLQVENPTVYQAIKDAKAQAGQVLPQPVQVLGRFLVLKLEARLAPQSLTPQERQDATRRINAYRMSVLLDDNRKGYPVEYVTPIAAVAADSR